MTLNAATIKNIKPGQIVWDRGLGVRGNADGSATYLVSYYDANKKKQRKVLGYTDRYKLSEVQRLVGERLGAWQRGEATLFDAGDTIADLADAYMVKHSEELNAPGTVKLNRHILNLYILPTLGNHKIGSVTKRQISDFVSEVAARSRYQANKVRLLLSAMFNFAHVHGYLAESAPNPLQGFKVAGRSANYPVQSRKRPATDMELRALLATLEAQPEPWRTFFLMLLHTGARPGELVKLQTPDIYDGWATFRRTKNGLDRRVPLHPTLLGYLGKLEGGSRTAPTGEGVSPYAPTQNGEEQEVFMGGHAYQRAWLRWCAAAGVSNLRVYDIRHTVATKMEAVTLDRESTVRLLGHKGGTMTDHYVEIEDQRLKAAVWKWVERLQTI